MHYANRFLLAILQAKKEQLFSLAGSGESDYNSALLFFYPLLNEYIYYILLVGKVYGRLRLY